MGLFSPSYNAAAYSEDSALFAGAPPTFNSWGEKIIIFSPQLLKAGGTLENNAEASEKQQALFAGGKCPTNRARYIWPLF